MPLFYIKCHKKNTTTNKTYPATKKNIEITLSKRSLCCLKALLRAFWKYSIVIASCFFTSNVVVHVNANKNKPYF